MLDVSLTPEQEAANGPLPQASLAWATPSMAQALLAALPPSQLSPRGGLHRRLLLHAHSGGLLVLPGAAAAAKQARCSGATQRRWSHSSATAPRQRSTSLATIPEPENEGLSPTYGSSAPGQGGPRTSGAGGGEPRHGNRRSPLGTGMHEAPARGPPALLIGPWSAPMPAGAGGTRSHSAEGRGQPQVVAAAACSVATYEA
jgi:hypothetical protein